MISSPTLGYCRIFLTLKRIMTANFREIIGALKEAGLADSEILEIMSNSGDSQLKNLNI